MDPKDVLKAFRLDGKLALVTGASRGLGRAMALGLAGFAATFDTRIIYAAVALGLISYTIGWRRP